MLAVIIKITLSISNIFNIICLNDLLSDIPKGECSSLFFSSTLDLCPKSSPVKYWHFYKRSLGEKTDILTTSLPKSY